MRLLRFLCPEPSTITTYRVLLVRVLSLALGFSALILGQGSETKEFEPVPQPVAFSHKQHAAVEGLECRGCHRTASTGESAGLPSASDCMSCHEKVSNHSPEIKKIAEYVKEDRQIRWVRVYRLPYYVFFSHEKHHRAGITCAECHGNVQDRHVLGKEKDISMASCIECHKAMKASIECNLCHELNQ